MTRPLALILAATLSWSTPVLAQDTLPPPDSAPAQTTDLPGAYLAARQAAADSDFAAAALWYDRALQSDPTNPALLEGSVTAHLALGDVEQAARSAQALLEAGAKNQIAYIAILAADAVAGRYDKVLADQKAGHTIGALIDKLISAWAEVGTGNMGQAQADFDAIIANPATQSFGLYHKALALAASGDFEGADRLLSSPPAAAAMTLRRAVLAHAEILGQLERAPEGVAVIDKAFGTNLDDSAAALRATLAAGQAAPFDVARTARDGLAEVFFTLATALNEQADQTFVLIYARTAATLRPDHAEAQLMTASLLQNLGQLDLAFDAFTAIPASDPAYITAQIGAADVALRLDRVDDATALLTTLSIQKPGDLNVLTALGDAQRRQGKCDLAVKSYDAAIALLKGDAPGNWPFYYKRASCQGQLGNWPAAEADFRIALKLSPDQPRVLNELGYSYVDRGENLPEALEMIQRAVAASPESGYIIDSLAWAYFRMGRYAEAVAPQEKASKLMPLDPIVTDHLGDIYWMAGRKREAQFQWRRALSFSPEDKDKARIERKLEVGLDVVLAEEKAAAPKGN